ncbi:MAG: helix-turn-helix domain-containing protein [Defluviitaleaceae bacterium]|nr:helix-turn-helix domain-containing protein [Defluviitaleaceae bacterium]
MREYKANMRPSRDFITEKAATFGENVRLNRKKMNLTADSLAKFLSISTAYVGLIERGERCPSMETFLRICNFFGKGPEVMLRHESASTLKEESDESSQRRQMVLNMLNTFDPSELEHVISMIKSFKDFVSKDFEDEPRKNKVVRFD